MTPDAWEALFRSAIDLGGYTIDVANLYVAIATRLPRKYALRDYIRIFMRAALSRGPYEVKYGGYPHSRSEPILVSTSRGSDEEADRLYESIRKGIVFLPSECAISGLQKTISYHRTELPEIRLRRQAEIDRDAAKRVWKCSKALRSRVNAAYREVRGDGARPPRWRVWFERFPKPPKPNADVYELTEIIESIDEISIALAEIKKRMEEYDATTDVSKRIAAWQRITSAIEDSYRMFAEDLESSHPSDNVYDEYYYPND